MAATGESGFSHKWAGTDCGRHLTLDPGSTLQTKDPNATHLPSSHANDDLELIEVMIRKKSCMTSSSARVREPGAVGHRRRCQPPYRPWMSRFLGETLPILDHFLIGVPSWLRGCGLAMHRRKKISRSRLTRGKCLSTTPDGFQDLLKAASVKACPLSSQKKVSRMKRQVWARGVWVQRGLQSTFNYNTATYTRP